MTENNRTDHGDTTQGRFTVSRRGVFGVGAAALAVVGVGAAVTGCDSNSDNGSAAEEASKNSVDPSGHITDQHSKAQSSLPFSDTQDFADT
ncbi:hypothetical protein, partial [Streptomyces sp. NPDC101166]|uniref:hypothetical protein n=1 Tax=Streptomyces sp. NPDC101166 TaxID=3366120 RepID=UPI0038289C26